MEQPEQNITAMRRLVVQHTSKGLHLTSNESWGNRVLATANAESRRRFPI